MGLKYEKELADAADKRRENYKALAFRCARNESLPASEVEAACEAAGKSPDEFKRLVERVVARKKAASDLKEAAKLAGEQVRIGDQLEAAHRAVKDAEERVEQLRREQTEIVAQSSILSGRVNSMRSAATATLQSTADPAAADPLDPAAVRIDDPAPQSAALPLPSVATWHPGETAVLPSMRTVSRR